MIYSLDACMFERYKPLAKQGVGGVILTRPSGSARAYMFDPKSIFIYN